MASIKQSLSGTLGVAIVLGIVIAANIIISQVRAVRADFTEENLYTLSSGTKTMLKDMERDATLKFYFSKSSESTPIPIKQYAQRIRDLLSEYETHSGGKVLLETYDPRPDSDEEEWAQKYGLAGQGMSMFGGDSLYLGLVAVSGAKEAAIPFLDPGAEPRLEYLVTRLLHEVTATDRARIGVLSSLPVMGGPPPMPYAQRQPQNTPKKWTVFAELERLYDVVDVPVTTTEIADDITTLVVVHPRELGEPALFAIDQFVLRGGRVMAFLDAMCMSDDTSQQNQFQQFGAMQAASDLNRLTETWGITYNTQQVVGDIKAATRLNVGGGKVDRVITWLSLREDQIDRAEVATSSLEFLMMPFAGSFTGEPAEGLTMTPLIQTSDNSGQLDKFQAMGSSAAMVEALAKSDPAPLALRLQGTFKTAVPDGKPGDDDASGSEEGESVDADGPAALTESEAPGVVILVGDVDMLHDQNTVRTMQFFNQTIAEPLNDNINLLLNFAEQLAGSDALIGLRSRGTYERPFDKVIELQENAQKKWQLEEQQLQAKVQETQSRLSSLQSGKQQDQKMIISPEQRAEIDKLNDEIFKTRQELKDVRKNLRRDIEQLGLTLKVVNIAAVPLVVGFFGIVRGVGRRRRSTRAVV